MRPAPCDVRIVDDEPEVLLAAQLVLKKAFRDVVTSGDPRQIPALIAERFFDVILLDMNFSAGATSGQEGIHWLTRAQSLTPDTKFPAPGESESGSAITRCGPHEAVPQDDPLWHSVTFGSM
jgi:DNA-binding NtrC family response regulator